jgi:hypothetical protein
MRQKQHQCLVNLLRRRLPPNQHQHNLLPQGNGLHLHSRQQAFLRDGLKTSGTTLVGSTSNQ